MFLKNCGNAFHVNCGKVKQYIAEMNKYVLKKLWECNAPVLFIITTGDTRNYLLVHLFIWC